MTPEERAREITEWVCKWAGVKAGVQAELTARITVALREVREDTLEEAEKEIMKECGESENSDVIYVVRTLKDKTADPTNAEDQYVEDSKNNCPGCGGSGHIDDWRARAKESGRQLKENAELMKTATFIPKDEGEKA